MTSINAEQVLDSVKKIQNILSQEIDISSLPPMVKALYRLVPDEIILFYSNYAEIRELDCAASVFWGYEPIDIREILDGIHPNDFFESVFEARKEYDTELINLPFLDVDRDNTSEEPILLDKYKLVPLFVEGYEYVYFHLAEERNTYGLISETDSIGIYAAPSLIEHLSGLTDGLSTKTYFLSEQGYIAYPGTWFERRLVKSGRAQMDKFGVVHHSS